MALGVPPDLAKQHPHIFISDLPSRRARKTHMLSVVQLIPLQEIFVQALSSTAYSKAKADISSFEDWLCRGQNILRQDSVYTLDTQDSADPGRLKYKVIMTEPVLQGYAEKSQTSFTLLPPTEDPHAIHGNENGVLLSPSFPEDIQTTDDEGLEIGESFLASSLIPQPSAFSQENDSPTIRVSSLAHAFIANPLSTRTSLDVDEYTMYVRTVDLPKVGLLDGDWVSANCKAGKRRLIKWVPGHSTAPFIEKSSYSQVRSQRRSSRGFVRPDVF